MAATVEKLGYVPPCVKDAFAWLPHPWGEIGRGKKKTFAWFWEGVIRDRKVVFRDGPIAPSIMKPDGKRCQCCIFQEPEWSQNYAACTFSWLNDHDGDCQAFFDRQEFLSNLPDYANFCTPPGYPPEVVDSGLLKRPYRPDGTLYSSFGPSCNLPSHFFARLNLRKWYSAPQVQDVYWAIERERTRRFWQKIGEEALEKEGAYQLHLFL